MQLCNAFVLPSSAVHKNQYYVVVLRKTVWKIHVARLFLCLSSPNTEQTLSFVVGKGKGKCKGKGKGKGTP
jgi:hypothetical protein